MRKLICLVIVAALLGVLAVGCAQDGGAGGDGGEVTYVAMWAEGEPAGDVMREIANAFEEETGISVNLVLAGRENLTMIQTDILMGEPPDIVCQDLSEINAALMAAETLLMPLTDLLDGPGPDGQARFRDIFTTADLDLWKQAGQDYYIPNTKATSGFHYNKTLFRNLGISPPTTWDEFIANGEVLLANGLPPLALDGNINFYNGYYYYWAIQRVLGSGALTAASTDPTGATWDDPGYLRAAELVHELSSAGRNFFQPGYEGSAFPAAQSDWALGLSGSVLCGTWIPNETMDLVDDDWEFGFYGFPTVPGGLGAMTDVEAYIMGFAILKDAPNPDNAKEFIRFSLKKEWADLTVELTHNLHGRNDIAAPAVLADVAPFLANATSAHLSYDGAMGMAPEWFANVFYTVNDALTFGRITPEEFISEIKQLTIDYWAGNIDLEGAIR